MKNRGLTLIELLIVIAIAAIIAGAMVPMFTVTRQDAKIAKAKHELDVIKTAALTLHFDTGRWPAIGSDGTGLVTNNDGTGTPIPGWQGPYLDEWHKDPWGVVAYNIYVVAGSPVKCGVQSPGGDGIYYTADDIRLTITPDYNN